MRVTFLRRSTGAVLVIGSYVVLQRRDVEAKDEFLALNRVVLTAPFRHVPLVTAVVAVWLTRCWARIRHGVIVYRSGPLNPRHMRTYGRRHLERAEPLRRPPAAAGPLPLSAKHGVPLERPVTGRSPGRLLGTK